MLVGCGLKGLGRHVYAFEGHCHSQGAAEVEAPSPSAHAGSASNAQLQGHFVCVAIATPLTSKEVRRSSTFCLATVRRAASIGH